MTAASARWAKVRAARSGGASPSGFAIPTCPDADRFYHRSCVADWQAVNVERERCTACGRPVHSVRAIPADAPLPADVIKADPDRFQFKRDAYMGVTTELANVEHFDPHLASIIAVWRDPVDGEVYVVNGHHRLELAQRTGHPTLVCQWIDATTDREARMIGALINIAEGRGTPIDAAIVFRDGNLDAEALRRRGVSPDGPVARDGLGLAQLAPALFRDVLLCKITVARGALIGRDLPEHEAQHGLVRLLAKRRKPLNDDEVRELIRFARCAGNAERDDAQGGFGFAASAESLVVEKAQLAAAILGHLRRDRRLFRAVASAASADVLKRGGNVIRADRNRSIAETTAQLEAIFQRLATRSGPVADALTTGARRLRGGAPLTTIAPATFEAIRVEIASLYPGVHTPNELTGGN